MVTLAIMAIPRMMTLAIMTIMLLHQVYLSVIKRLDRTLSVIRNLISIYCGHVSQNLKLPL